MNKFLSKMLVSSKKNLFWTYNSVFFLFILVLLILYKVTNFGLSSAEAIAKDEIENADPITKLSILNTLLDRKDTIVRRFITDYAIRLKPAFWDKEVVESEYLVAKTQDLFFFAFEDNSFYVRYDGEWEKKTLPPGFRFRSTPMNDGHSITIEISTNRYDKVVGYLNISLEFKERYLFFKSSDFSLNKYFVNLSASNWVIEGAMATRLDSSLQTFNINLSNPPDSVAKYTASYFSRSLTLSAFKSDDSIRIYYMIGNADRMDAHIFSTKKAGNVSIKNTVLTVYPTIFFLEDNILSEVRYRFSGVVAGGSRLFTEDTTRIIRLPNYIDRFSEIYSTENNVWIISNDSLIQVSTDSSKLKIVGPYWDVSDFSNRMFCDKFVVVAEHDVTNKTRFEKIGSNFTRQPYADSALRELLRHGEFLLPTYSPNVDFIIKLPKQLGLVNVTGNNIGEYGYQFVGSIQWQSGDLSVTSSTDPYYLVIIIVSAFTAYFVGYLIFKSFFDGRIAEPNAKIFDRLPTLKQKMLEIASQLTNLKTRSDVMLILGIIFGVGGVVASIFLFQMTNQMIDRWSSPHTIISIFRPVVLLIFIETFTFFFPKAISNYLQRVQIVLFSVLASSKLFSPF